MSDVLPLGVRLTGRPVLVVGGGAVAARRARMLHRSGARVTVISPQLCPDMEELIATSQYAADQAHGYRVVVHHRTYRDGDVHGMWLVATATSHREVDDAVAQAAEDNRVFCLKGGDPHSATAWAPALTTHGDSTIAVLSQGHSPNPRRSIRLRDKIAAFLTTHPEEPRLARGRTGTPQQQPTHTPPVGHVTLVGGGPGALGLLTIAGKQAIEHADVLVMDRLAPQEARGYAPAHAEIIDVGKTGGRHPVSQAEIHDILIDRATAGLHVVRLKGGDPYVFGRGGEEYEACTRHNIPVTVLPGVTSAVSVPAAAGIPVTHRGVSRGFTVLTGHCDLDKAPLAQDHTVVLLMGVSRLEELTAQLIAQGNSANTPCAIIEDGYGPRQRTTTGTLASIAQTARQVGVQSPAITVVGDVAAFAHSPFNAVLPGSIGQQSPARHEGHAQAGLTQ